MALTLRDLRRYALARSLFAPTTLSRAVERFGFVQADPIRAPARAQDLTLRHRVRGYRAGDLERRYPELAIEEEFFVNYGFVPRSLVPLMHPRVPRRAWSRAMRERAKTMLAFIEERGAVHPRDVDRHFAHGTVTNYWGGSSNATTQLLDQMHYRGLLRVARREAGVRVYAPRSVPPPPAPLESPQSRMDALLALAVRKYAPLPAQSLGQLASRLRLAAPQLAAEVKPSLKRGVAVFASARIDGVTWYWPGDEEPTQVAGSDAFDAVRFLAPFDPVVWDRRRFELFWGWPYRFEAYTPVSKRKLGYYALPLLWRESVVGWANVGVQGSRLVFAPGYVNGSPPRGRVFAAELECELERMRIFLGLG